MKTKYMFKNLILAITIILRKIFSTVNRTVFNTEWHIMMVLSIDFKMSIMFIQVL